MQRVGEAAGRACLLPDRMGAWPGHLPCSPASVWAAVGGLASAVLVCMRVFLCACGCTDTATRAVRTARMKEDSQ